MLQFNRILFSYNLTYIYKIFLKVKYRFTNIFSILFLFSCIFFCADHADANYITPGNGRNWNLDSLVLHSGGNVTYSGGIYYINDTITISWSDTLKIRTNAIVKLAALVFVDIRGVMRVIPPDSVMFTAIDTTQMFYGFRLDSLSGSSIFKNMIFEWGNAVKLVGCDMIIDSCTFRNNKQASSFSGTVGGVINIFRSNPIISNCRIYRNRRAAIISSFNIPSSPRIINNLIFENDIDNYNTPQINLGAAGQQPIIIRNNTIRGLYPMAGGISIFPGGSVPLVIIENNKIKRNRYGIALLGTNIYALIRNNIIDSNTTQGIPYQGGSGINLNGKSSLVAKISGNFIRWNLWGVTIQDSAKPSLGNILSTDTNDIGLNQIYGNYHNDTIPDLFNNTPDSVKAENNWWGTTIVDSIEKHIFHKPDNPLLGFVDYIPFRLIAGINETVSVPEKFTFETFPNPFNAVQKIRYTIIERGFYSIKISDLLGREVMTIKEGEMIPGKQEALWNAETFSSGIYFCRITGMGVNGMQKLVLVK